MKKSPKPPNNHLKFYFEIVLRPGKNENKILFSTVPVPVFDKHSSHFYEVR